MDNFGICRLGAIPLRKESSHRSEMISQLLFGEHYYVHEISADGEWVRVENHFDGYRGWIPSNQHHSISEAYFEQINESDYKICCDTTSTILFQKSPVSIVLGSIIPISTNELFKMEEQLAFGGESKSIRQKREYEYLRQIAIKLRNAPYLWGGRTPFGIDCSGFVQIVFKVCGYVLPRDSSDQSKIGEIITNLDETKAGDLAFFKTGNKVDHVGIILDDQNIIHASGKVRIDKISEEGIKNSKTGILSHKKPSYRRILN